MEIVEKIREGIFCIKVPLPGNPLKSINSYVLSGLKRNLVVDTGMNMKPCLDAIRKGFEELKLDISKTDFFITHMHADHSGLVAVLATDESAVYFNKREAEFLLKFSNDYWEKVISFMKTHGFPEEEAEKAVLRHPGFKYIARGPLNLFLVNDGEEIDIGNFRFRILHTPGHTPGHMCLYEPDKKILFSGDHILGDITPNISAWSDEEAHLDDYFKSLDRISVLDVELVLPGHRRAFPDCRGRIEELKRHHEQRLREVVEIIGNGRRTAYEVASFMKWDIDFKSWDEFPVLQKWFAVGEAIAHLKFLEERGILLSGKEEGVIFYRKR